MMIASDTGQSKSKVTPISILSIQLHSNFRAQIVYGQTPFLAFETIVSILHFFSYCKATDLKNCLVETEIGSDSNFILNHILPVIYYCISVNNLT